MDLQKLQDTQIATLSDNYQVMLKEITDYFPVIEKATNNFNKSQSQFMNNMLTVSHPTELRNVRQILAEVERTKQALSEAYFSVLKKKNEIKRKEQEIPEASDPLSKELLGIEIAELQMQLKTSQGYIEGAIRKISAYMHQYQQILRFIGKEDFTEGDFEKDEERYHIMKMFEQGLCAARANGGHIDEGNQIYAHQIGLNGTVANMELRAYMLAEKDMMEKGIVPTHKMTMDWLKSMADKYEGSAFDYASRKGMMLLDKKALHQEVIE